MEEDYICFEGDIFIDIAHGINGSYLDKQSEGHRYRNWVYDSIDSCCLTYQGLVDAVNSYEEALGIKLISKQKHKKSLAGIILHRDRKQ